MIALFISLGGTTYAVTSLPRNSVGNAQLRDRAVTEKELGNRAVISSKLAKGAVINSILAEGTIQADRLATDSLDGMQIDESLLGRVPLALNAERATLADRAALADRADRADQADRAMLADRATTADRAGGAGRADSADVARGLERVVYSREKLQIPETGPTKGVHATPTCPLGLKAVAGGFVQEDDSDDPALVSTSGPEPSGNAWKVFVVDGFTDSATPALGSAYAVCVVAREAG